MALITCPECAKEVSDKAPACPHCGVPIRVESKVMVYGYTQHFAINPKIEVLWQGRSLGKVKKGDFLEFPIDQDGEVTFRCGPRRASLSVRSGQVNKIKISWDRISGKMVPQHVDSITP